MIAALEAIVKFLGMIVDFVVMIINHIIHFITSLPTYVMFLRALFNSMPGFLQWFIMAALFYGIINVIINKVRGSND